jgi:lysozyme family protein
MTTAAIINGVLDREGAEFDDDPADRGGPCKFGVTLPVLAEFRGQSVTVAQLQALTREEAAEVYEHLYLNRSGFLHIADERARVLLLDFAVNSGIGTATKALQRLLGVEADGICGPVTLGAANALDGRALVKALGLARQRFYVQIVQHDPEQIRFLQGWLNRNWAVAVEPL